MQTKMYNPTLEDFTIQCNSRVFTFSKRAHTLVDNDLVDFVYTQVKDRGVFPIYPSMTKDEIKKANRSALLLYLEATLKQRIRNYVAQQDDFKKKGVTFTDDHNLVTARRWEKEIVAMLEVDAPINEELSFIDSERRKAIGVDGKFIQDFAGEALFDSDDILAENGMATPEVEKRRAGRPRKSVESFTEVNVDQIG